MWMARARHGYRAPRLGRLALGIKVLFEDHPVQHYNVGLTNALSELGCHVQRFRLSYGILGIVRPSFAVLRLARVAREFDVVHVNRAIHLDLIALFLVMRKKLVLTYHGGQSLSTKNHKESFLACLSLLSLKVASRLGARVVTVSNFTASSLRSGIGLRTSVIYHGVDTERFRRRVRKSDARKTFRIPDDKTVVLWVGRVHPRKDPATLLRAAEQLRDSNPELLFVMNIHVRAASAEAHALVNRAGLASSVRIIYDVPFRSMPDLYAAADIFVSTSRVEGFGLAVIEAMASGLPVIVADSGAPAEFVGEGGVKFRGGDYVDLAEKISALSADDLARRRIGLAAAEVANRFTWREAAEAYLRVYRS